MAWIDTHVHLFSDKDDNKDIPLLYPLSLLNTLDNYLKALNENKPQAVVVVDFSKSKDSQHVISSLDELKQKGIKAAGVIKANLNDERTLQWLGREDVKAIRIYAKESLPDLGGEKWANIFAKIKQKSKHILVFGEGENLVGTIRQIPKDITILIDHLGCPDINNKDESYEELLEIAAVRSNIYFKGPGYRTSLDVEKVKPIVKKIVSKVGINRLMLGASDAPFAGIVSESDIQYANKKFCEVMDYQKVIAFVKQLADSVSSSEIDTQKILCNNAKELYGF
jgi:predicted TIM-barrel fold metal-dependent hydrolase